MIIRPQLILLVIWAILAPMHRVPAQIESPPARYKANDGPWRVQVIDQTWRDAKRTVDLPLHKFSTREGERRVRVEESGRDAITVFRLERVWSDHDPPLALLEAELKTGRTHQIRVHLTHLGHVLAGDDKYGDFAWNRELATEGLKRMFLHARTLTFTHPASGKSLKIESPLPRDLRSFLQRLEESRSW